MKVFRLILALVLVVAFMAPLAWSEEGIMRIKTKGVAHERPIVGFTHTHHEALVDCKVCHHDFYKNSVYGHSEGSKCVSCHKDLPTLDNPLPLKQAMHQRCKGCHQSLMKQQKPTGPLMCGQCHQK